MAGTAEGTEKQVPLSVKCPGSLGKVELQLPWDGGEEDGPWHVPWGSRQPVPQPLQTPALQLDFHDEILPSKQGREIWEAITLLRSNFILFSENQVFKKSNGM